MNFEYISSRELYDLHKEGSNLEKESIKYVELDGWIRTNRNNGKIGFIELNDGTFFRNVQLVYNNDKIDDFEKNSKLKNGSSINVIGELIFTKGGKQPFEIKVKKIKLIGDCQDDYVLQKKRHGFEFLRDIAHLRPRTNTFSAVFRVRSVLSMAIHEFFQTKGFVYLHAPIITGNDAEGAGETFTVTTRKDGDYEKDFFGKKASLTVSGQLNAEAYALAFRDVYTFGPTFRAENSNTIRHASEFWMIEPEVAFADLEDNMVLIEDCVKFCIDYVLKKCPEEMEFFDKRIEQGLLKRLKKLLNSDFSVMKYEKAVDILKKVVSDENKIEFENKDIHFGMDLQSEHERYLCEKVVEGPLFLIDYPKTSKSFYMRLNDDNKTVAACDLLVPYVGELVGGSQREERLDILEMRMNELGVEKEGLEWFLDLRKYGGCKHSGFGIGFERLLMYITGMKNIRDVISFPRTPRSLKY